MELAQLAITTEEDLHSVVDLAPSVHHHRVESLSRRGYLQVTTVILALFTLRLALRSRQIDNTASSHLLLDLELERLHRL